MLVFLWSKAIKRMSKYLFVMIISHFLISFYILTTMKYLQPYFDSALVIQKCIGILLPALCSFQSRPSNYSALHPN